ncbi:MAG: DUF4860 domain-containing protein [Parasporobacterium sp.]|nr:DUF4860 domain-containing protein [Parasporobacterium sp.]
MKKKTASDKAKSFGYLGTAFLALAGIVAAVALVTVTYLKITDVRDASDALRGTVSYIKTQIASYDNGCPVYAEDGRLVLTEQAEDITYEQRIYLYDGYMVEEYTVEGLPDNPGNAVKVMPVKELKFTFVKDNLLHIQTEYGEGYAYIYGGH